MIVVAHRGSSGSAPENTIAAFRAAGASGAAWIELDVRFSSDDVCVVIHDRTVRRTTNGRGAVHTLAHADLHQLDAGAWFSRRFAGERVPTLAEVLRVLPGSIGLNCEVKTDGDPRPRVLRARILADTLQTHLRGRRVIVSSFDHRFLATFAHHAPGVALGVLLMPVRDTARRASRLARSVHASFVFCSRRQIRRRMVADAHRHGLSIGVYTVDLASQLSRMQRYGVDMVFTNHPEVIVPCLSQQ